MDNYDLNRILLTLHILSAIVGFGGLFLNNLYLSRARSVGGREGAAILAANTWVSSKVADMAVYAAGIFGVLLVMFDGPGDLYEFSQSWISMGFALLLVSVGLVHGGTRPAVTKFGEALNSAADGNAEAAAMLPSLEKRATMFAAAGNLALVAILAVMIWKPGL